MHVIRRMALTGVRCCTRRRRPGFAVRRQSVVADCAVPDDPYPVTQITPQAHEEAMRVLVNIAGVAFGRPAGLARTAKRLRVVVQRSRRHPAPHGAYTSRDVSTSAPSASLGVRWGDCRRPGVGQRVRGRRCGFVRSSESPSAGPDSVPTHCGRAHLLAFWIKRQVRPAPPSAT